MNTDTITTRLHAKADADLRKKLNESVEWIWQETQYRSNSQPKMEDHNNVVTAINNAGRKWETMPWIGSIISIFKEVAFAYLRDDWRKRYVSEFMGKVESMAEEMENLGIVIQQREEEQQ